jgi:hypothetical protein
VRCRACCTHIRAWSTSPFPTSASVEHPRRSKDPCTLSARAILLHPPRRLHHCQRGQHSPDAPLRERVQSALNAISALSKWVRVFSRNGHFHRSTQYF